MRLGYEAEGLFQAMVHGTGSSAGKGGRHGLHSEVLLLKHTAQCQHGQAHLWGLP